MYAPTSRESREKLELNRQIEAIDRLMQSGAFDEAVLRWLQAGTKTEEIFDQVLAKYNPVFVADLQPLLLLSVGATVSNDLSPNNQKLGQKVSILEMVIYSFNNMVPTLDDQVREVTPKIMTLLKSRIEDLLMGISRMAPNDQSLKSLANMANVAGRIADNVRARQNTGHHGAPY
jgi:hypothetical protein